jgi:DNA-directed RNA polymerase specialized sigma24 family protein
MASYKIFDDPDMRQDALVMFMRYINRYDWRKNTSAFAYITEIITNSINLTLKKRAKDYLDGAIVLESQLEDKVLVSMFKGMDTEGYGTTDE